MNARRFSGAVEIFAFGLAGMEPVIHELRQFAAMVRRAMDYLAKG